MRLFAAPVSTEVELGRLRLISENAALRTEARTLEERLRVTNVVWEFVRSRDRIVYGGAALDALVGAKDPSDSFYRDKACDIEFYSPEPAKDVVDLCDLLHGVHKLDFVQGREAVHTGTLTVSVNFRRVCDTTFAPERTLARLPFLRAPCGARCVHPHVMAMDLLRMLSEPDTSYWRLEKAYVRINLLETHFPLAWDCGHAVTVAKEWIAGSVTRAVSHMTRAGRCVVVGERAAVFYGGALGADLPIGGAQLVSLAFEDDVLRASSFLSSVRLKGLRAVSFQAFGDLLGRSVRFVDSRGSCILELIDAHPRCVPTSPVLGPEGPVASSLFCIANAMACHLRAFVTDDQTALVEQSIICSSLLRSRQRDAPALGSGDNAAEDFGLGHVLGETVTDMRIQALAHGHRRAPAPALAPSTERGARRERGRARSARPGGKAHDPPRSRGWLRYNPSEVAADDRQRKRMLQCTFVARTGEILSDWPVAGMA
ncbi:MAG: hypothetical protein WDW38_006595 [Sanguina aurantia]